MPCISWCLSNGKERQKLLQHSEDEEYDVDNNDQGATFDEALVATGFGRFHYLLVLFAGICNASDIIELMSISVLLPAAQCDLHMGTVDKGWLNTMVLFGSLVGGYVWGSMGDVFGRRTVLINSLMVNGLAAIASAFVQTFGPFVFLRFVSGVGIGGSIPLTFAYASEFLSADRRGRGLAIVGSFWVLGSVFVAVVALGIIPLDVNFVSKSGFSFSSWRLFVVVSSLPTLISALWLYYLPESPMFLLMSSRGDAALAVLRDMFSRNTGCAPEEYSITSLRPLDARPPTSTATPAGAAGHWHAFVSVIKRSGRQTADMFAPALLKLTLVILFMNYGLQFGYFGLLMWFPELFNRLQDYYATKPDHQLTVCQLSDLNALNITVVDPCSKPGGPVTHVALINNLIISVAPLPFCFWLVLHVDKLGRKFFLGAAGLSC